MLVAPPRQDESDHAHLIGPCIDDPHVGARPEEEDRGFMILSVWTSSEIVIIRSATDTFSTHNAQLHTRSAAPLPSLLLCTPLLNFSLVLSSAGRERGGTIVQERRHMQIVVRRSLQGAHGSALDGKAPFAEYRARSGTICENEKRERAKRENEKRERRERTRRENEERERAKVLSNRRRSARTPSDRSRESMGS